VPSNHFDKALIFFLPLPEVEKSEIRNSTTAPFQGAVVAQPFNKGCGEIRNNDQNSNVQNTLPHLYPPPPRGRGD